MLTWLPGVLRAAGLTVVERAGWATRGDDRIVPQGVIGHHTATGHIWTDEAVARLLEKGRADLPGPLAQLGLRRSGVFEVIAAGRCNHNGYGTLGNDSVGIEAYNSGLGETWPAVQLDAFDRGVAAILRHLNFGADRYLGHREADPGRKIDPAGIDLDAQRKRITALLQEGDDVATTLWRIKGRPEVWAVSDGLTKSHVQSQAALAYAQALLVLGRKDSSIHVIADTDTNGKAWLNGLPVNRP